MGVSTCDKLFMEKHGLTFQKSLGEGAYGTVVKAYCSRMRRNYAVKIINGSKVETSYLLKFLPRELEVMKALNHPNVITTYHILEQSICKVFVVMELCVNGDLCGYLSSRGPLPEESSRTFFLQLCRAVQYLHNLHVTHRDLKCDNLLLDQNHNIKVCDFGMCRRLTFTGGHMDFSRTFCGTSSYTAPEVLRSVPYNPVVADVWSMGVVLFRMLYDHLPFDSAHVLLMVRLQMGHKIHFLDSVHVSPQAVALIKSILQADVGLRISLDGILCSPWMMPSGRVDTGNDPKRNKPKGNQPKENQPKGNQPKGNKPDTKPRFKEDFEEGTSDQHSEK
ncbi:unnamed protein product [Knipowitschia caucasica]